MQNNEKPVKSENAQRGIRTPDLMVRSHALYPTELAAQRVSIKLNIKRTYPKRKPFHKIDFTAIIREMFKLLNKDTLP